jgi:hypothetical protein
MLAGSVQRVPLEGKLGTRSMSPKRHAPSCKHRNSKAASWYLVGSSEVARECYAPPFNRIPYVKGPQCPKGPRGEKRPADVIGAAIMVGRNATGKERPQPLQRKVFSRPAP